MINRGRIVLYLLLEKDRSNIFNVLFDFPYANNLVKLDLSSFLRTPVIEVENEEKLEIESINDFLGAYCKRIFNSDKLKCRIFFNY